MEGHLDAPHSVISKSRLEFLFDGIFAIAMTLLVLELKVPEIGDRKSVTELAHALAHNAAGFVSYLFSFIVLGIFWYRHNWAYRYITRVSGTLLALHFVQLAMAAFFPFTAALLGRYTTNTLSLAVYVGCCMVYLWCSFGIWVSAKRSGVLHVELKPADFVDHRRSALSGAILLTALFVVMFTRVLTS